MNYTTAHEDASGLYHVTLTGTMNVAAAQAMLEDLWIDAEYLDSIAIIYDIGGLDALPDVNDMLVLSRFIARHKAERGPRNVAFVAPEFVNPGMKRVFAGFAKIVGLTLHFCAHEAQARAALDLDSQHRGTPRPNDRT